MFIDDLFVKMRLEYSRRFLDIFESQITSQIGIIRSLPLSGFEKKMWTEEARRTLRYAFFLRYYASFESHLKTICDRFADSDSLPLRLSDVRGDDFLSRVNKYTTHIVGCEALDKHQYWLDIRGYYWIRNTIIHGDGRVNKGGKLPQYIVTRQLELPAAGFGMSKSGAVQMKRRFCYRAVARMGQFLLDVYGRKK